MVSLRFATLKDKDFWFELDRHLDNNMFEVKLKLNQCFIIELDNKMVGVLRYNYFWDEIPFLNLIYILKEYRQSGIGCKALYLWESHIKNQGHKFIMTSTMANEQAQHFYRKQNYKDCGCLLKDNFLDFEPMEIFLCKQI